MVISILCIVFLYCLYIATKAVHLFSTLQVQIHFTCSIGLYAFLHEAIIYILYFTHSTHTSMKTFLRQSSVCYAGGCGYKYIIIEYNYFIPFVQIVEIIVSNHEYIYDFMMTYMLT